MSRIADQDKVRLRAAQRVRAEVYLEKGFLKPEDLTDGLDITLEDDRSIHIDVSDVCADTVGTLRIIRPNEAGLPICEIFDSLEIVERAVEVSRYVVLRQHRASVAALGLCRALCYELERNNVEYMYATLEKKLLESLGALGFPFEILGGCKKTYNSWNYPTRCKCDEILPEMRRRDLVRPFPKTAPYFERPFSYDNAWVSEELF